MSKCSCCKITVTSLCCSYEMQVNANFMNDGKYVDQYENLIKNFQFFCPKCGKKLFDDENDAFNFLND
jgi:hypothetical protein